MKKMLALALIVGLSVAARADININWFAQAGFYDNGQFGVDPNGGILFSGGNATAQLIWTPTASIDIVDPSNGANGYVSGDDIFLDSFTFTTGGGANTTYGDFSNGSEIYTDAAYAGVLGTNVLANGFVYYRVFTDNSPDGGEFYYDSATLDANAYTGVESPQSLDQENTSAGNELDTQIVPEPTTLAFMGIGSILVALRRRKS